MENKDLFSLFISTISHLSWLSKLMHHDRAASKISNTRTISAMYRPGAKGLNVEVNVTLINIGIYIHRHNRPIVWVSYELVFEIGADIGLSIF